MPLTPDSKRRRLLESLSRSALQQHQLTRLNQLLTEILPANEFYRKKLAGIDLPLSSLDQLAELPMTYKDELAGNSSNSHAANLTHPIEQYVRFHRTSGTQGRPMVVLDSETDWQWWIDTWQFVLDAADVTPADRVLMAFSFGPFIGFWSANDAIAQRGAMVIPGGGLSSLGRLDLVETSQATVLCCTPTYALRLAEVAEENQIQVADTSVNRVIVAGEPGGSIPSIRQRIEDVWQARVIDHSGASEIGPWGYADAEGRGLHVVESEFVAEFHSLETGQDAKDGEVAELILTTLGRSGCPVIRYRTGDLVRPTWSHGGDNQFVLLAGGVIGRADDMLVIRGVNIFPSSVEQILRGFPEVVEYRITARHDGEMDRLSVEIEDHLEQPDRVAKELHRRLALHVDVTAVSLGSLPRFEGKGRRFVDLRRSDQPERASVRFIGGKRANRVLAHRG